MAQEQNPAEIRTIEPCTHMETWVNGLADGSLKGVKRAYTRFHVAGCPKCRTALVALNVLHQRLGRLDAETPSADTNALSPERIAALQHAMDAAESSYNAASETQIPHQDSP